MISLEVHKESLRKACAVAIARQKKAFGTSSKATKIRRIGETNELFIIDFYKDEDAVVYGGGGLIVYKKDFSIDHYCIPSHPENIFEIIDNAVDVEIPSEYV